MARTSIYYQPSIDLQYLSIDDVFIEFWLTCKYPCKRKNCYKCSAMENFILTKLEANWKDTWPDFNFSIQQISNLNNYFINCDYYHMRNKGLISSELDLLGILYKV